MPSGVIHGSATDAAALAAAAGAKAISEKSGMRVIGLRLSLLAFLDRDL
ncbi:hypothetical protein Maq22A_c24705 [Methylobacterium aquaticum]|uniref:Uncharacterized protein n=1 Tax=Methylobacterium aquaticum TaxID=270351 RepID=A0A0C6FH45_9HYPH|nr:hypothetical protein Maq22A_c24705 [Methylobacterium aquaticum]